MTGVFRRIAGWRGGRGYPAAAWRKRHWIEKAVAGIDGALIAADRAGRVVFLNAIAEKLTGWTLAKASGRPLAEVLPLVDEPTGRPVADLVAPTVEEGTCTGWVRDRVLTARDGRTVPVEYRSAPIRGDGDRVEGVVLLVYDGTARRRVRDVIAQLAAIVETSEDAIVGVAMDGTISTWNGGAERLYGYAAEEIMGRPIALLFPPDVEPELAETWESIRRGEPIRNQDTVRRHRDGRRIEVSVSLSPIRGEGGEVAGFSSIARDISERKRREEQARRTELLRRLADAQEEERRRIARELHDQMGQSLTALKLGLEALKDEPLGPDRLQPLLDLVNRIGQEVRHIALELRPTTLDDLGLKTTLFSYLGEWSERSGVEVDFHDTGLDQDRLPSAVETAVYRIVQEALTNVLKHAGAGRVTLLLERRPDRLHAIIEDDGRGFDYEAATRGPGAERRLGLLGMQERIAALGGTLEVETGPGEGTSLFLRIPLPALEETDRHDQSARPPGR